MDVNLTITGVKNRYKSSQLWKINNGVQNVGINYKNN